MKGLVIATLIGCALSLSWQEELKTSDLLSLDLKGEFQSWASTFGKTYPDIDEKAHRYGIWLYNLHQITESNSLDLSYKLRMNQFGDMTNEEFSEYSQCLGAKKVIQERQKSSILGSDGHDNVRANPSSVDWTTQG